MKKLASLIALGLVVCLTPGCLSFQSYGSPRRGHSLPDGSARADVFANLGEPDSIYKSGDTEVFFYKAYQGETWFGVVNKIRREDTVVVMDGTGNVLTVSPIEVGQGLSVFFPNIIDATHPVKTTELTEKPENYEYKYTVEVSD